MTIDPIDLIKRFDELPDEVVPRRVTAFLLHKSERDLRRNSPISYIRTSERGGGNRVGDIRALVRRANSPAT